MRAVPRRRPVGQRCSGGGLDGEAEQVTQAPDVAARGLDFVDDAVAAQNVGGVGQRRLWKWVAAGRLLGKTARPRRPLPGWSS